jgi:signal transduction histidine kinase
MLDFLQKLFDAEFMPHGHCYFWKPEILWLHTVSDTFIALAYYSIPAALWYFVRKRRDLKFAGIFVLFGIFIFACGTTHVMGVWTTWNATYRLEGVVKLLTAAVSVGTAVVLWPLMPKALSLPSPAQLEERVRQRTAELEKANARLEGEVAEREAAERRLQQTASELAASNAELESFAYVASHDLMAPLHAMENLAKWLEEDLDGVLDAGTREKMELLLGRIDRMEALLTSLLDYSRAGHLKAEPEPVDFGDLLRETLELVAPPAGFTVETSGELPRLETFKVPLQQVLRNLLTNAVKHHHRGAGRLTVGVRDLGESYEFSVADDGPGIAPEFHESVFEIFRTLRPRDEFESSGMGLAIVRKTVESCGGSVSLESEAGRGATFRFTWPKVLPGRS